MERDLIRDLRAALGSAAVHDDLFARRAMARDASLYRMVPMAVVRPSTATDIVNLFNIARIHGAACTFRAAGTSLSGQAVTDGLLVDISRSWSSAQVLDGGDRIRVQPSVTGGRANAMLRRLGRRIGPDPASLMACMVGGIVANNASGMCCGTAHNSYHTIESMRYILADGTVCDTADPHADAHLAASAPAVSAAIAALRDEVRSNNDLVALIRRKYRIKNTVGYSLNAFLDEDRPARIIAKLMVGSEGTLGFIDEVVFGTIADARVKHTAIMVYASLDAACDDVSFWRDSGAAAVELMDDASLQSFATLPSTPPELRITQKGAAALLVEFHDVEPPARHFDGYATEWTTDPKRQAELWHLRKGLMPTVGAMRPTGTTMINEDVAAPPERLADLVRGVQASFARFGYDDGIIFGHAKDGNIHFVVNQRFETEDDITRYAEFMDDIARIVTGLDGSLKAEHGTGRNMAPFVEREWGTVAYGIMLRVKSILDPEGILNPGVVINADPTVHVRNIKPVPTVDASVNACIECGFCEHVCPTRSYTLTP
ncbi:MAG: FAD-binding protein, partial [Candidatus Kapabacteria bacterium]|nr:FAD-binding protein [Candidatus Kapabacteria bacterium]